MNRRAAVITIVLAGIVTGCVDAQLRARFTKADTGLLEPRAMHLVLCGTGGAIADPSRFGACSAVVAGGKMVLVDVGSGAWEGIDAARLPLDAVRIVFLTTFLAENISDLGEVMIRGWIAGRPGPLVVYGPPGTARLVANFADAFRADATMRVARHDPEILRVAAAGAVAHEFSFAASEDSALVLDEDGLRVTAFSVGAVGGIPSVGYRFDHRGRSIVFAGHARGHPNVARFAAGADILVHEAANPEMIARASRVMDEVGNERLGSLTREIALSFASPVEVATVARDAGVGLLVIARAYPPPNEALVRWGFLLGVRSIFPHAVLGEDGMRFRLDPKVGDSVDRPDAGRAERAGLP